MAQHIIEMLVVHGFVDESHRPQMLVDRRQKRSSPFDQVQIQRYEAHAARRVVVDDHPVAADHLFRAADVGPSQRSRAELMQRPQRQRLLTHLGHRAPRPEPDLQPADPERGDVGPHGVLADPAVARGRICNQRNNNGSGYAGRNENDRRAGPAHPRPERVTLSSDSHCQPRCDAVIC